MWIKVFAIFKDPLILGEAITTLGLSILFCEQTG
jgi:hypothetical protein